MISIFIDVYYICIYTYNVLYARYIYGERTWRKVPLFERFRVRGLPEQCKTIIPRGAGPNYWGPAAPLT